MNTLIFCEALGRDPETLNVHDCLMKRLTVNHRGNQKLKYISQCGGRCQKKGRPLTPTNDFVTNLGGGSNLIVVWQTF